MNEQEKYEWMVYVSCMTYNHAPYIVDAMNGFTMQETNFPFVCAIVDDASTDGEQEVIKNYLNEHFDLENKKVVRQEETDDYVLTFAQHKTNLNCFFAVFYLKYNHYSIKKPKNPYLAQWRDKAKYIALCEGDDYWTEPHKLQIQVDFLESHPEIPYSCTRFKILVQKNGEISLAPNYYFDQPVNQGKNVWIFSREDAFSKGWTTKTLTSVYRRGYVNMASLSQYKYNRDVHLFNMLLSKGNGVCHSFVGGVYRKNEDSTYGGKTRLEQYRQNYLVYEELYEKTHDPIFRGMTLVCYLPLFKERVPDYKWPKNSLQLYAILIYWPKTILFEFKNKIKQLFIHHKVNE